MSVSNGVYRLRNVRSGTYLDASKREPGKVHGWDSRPENENQQWRVQQSHGGSWTIQNVSNGKYLSVDGVWDGSNVHVSQNQATWDIRQEGNSYVILADGSNSTVDLDMGRDDNGTDVNLWGDSGEQQQRWRFEQVSGGGGGGQYKGPLRDGAYFVRNVHTGTGIDLSGSKPEDGTRVIGFQAHTGDNQKWILQARTRGYSIKNAASGTYLGYGQQEQVHEGLLLTGNRNEVEWDIRQSDQGYQVYLAGETHLVLDLAQGDATDGAKICLWSNKNGANQKWRFDNA